MAEKGDSCALFGEFPDGWSNPFDPRKVSDFPVLHGNVQIHTHQDSFSIRFQRIKRLVC